MKRKAYFEGTPEQRQVLWSTMTSVLACLQALRFSYQSLHWQFKGYGNHLLFMRLYDDEDGTLDGQIDELAEKMVGYLGPECVDPVAQFQAVSMFIQRWTQVSDPIQRGLFSQKDLQTVLRLAYDQIDAHGAMTLGLDDWIMATASSQEANEYLLQQSAARREKQGLDLGPGSVEFYDNPIRKEVLEFAESKALSNSKAVAVNALEGEGLTKKEIKVEIKAVNKSPDTPSEIVVKPGGQAVGTLNRLVVDSEDPSIAKAVRMNRKRMAVWLDRLK